MAISRRLRFEILRRDGHTCVYCGAAPPDIKLTVDHVIPEALGGGNDPSNLVAACQQCNAGKSSLSPDAPIVAKVTADAARWGAALTAYAAEAAANREDRDQRRAAFEESWQSWTFLDYHRNRVHFRLPLDWPLSIDTFYAAGLAEEDVADLVDQAMRTEPIRDRFRYFASLCWKEIRFRQEAVRTVLAIEDSYQPQQRG